MNINVAAHRIDIAEPVETHFPAGQPHDPSQDPISFGKLDRQFRRIPLACGAAPDKNRVFREAGADLGADNMFTQGRAITTPCLTGAIMRAGNRIA